ncbi:MAG: orotate phosphoribosyltransferase [Burkholderiales bacterium]|jgi:orotate phosphoribosyltransferase|nr:orotate phosphoribosyltransferase [Burkholderiales bacterium]
MTSPIASKIIAEHLLNINAIMFLLENPVRFKSGMISPIYVDNRCLIFHPEAWHDVIEALSSDIEARKLSFDVIAGVETAGIPHSAALAYRLNIPNIFVRKQAKTHGTKNRVEGGDVRGKRVLLIEDHISTGLSSLDSVAALRESGAIVEDCMSITSYKFVEAADAFANAKVKTHTLQTFDIILDIAVQTGRISARQKEVVADWLNDPWPWARRHGLVAAGTEN